MMDKLGRLVEFIRDSIGFVIVGGVVLVLLLVFFGREGSGADPETVRLTQSAASLQRDLARSTDAVLLTQTPAAITLTEAAPTLSLLGRQEVAQFAAAASATSQLSDFDWAAIQAAGPPNVEGCTSSPNSWTTQEATGSLTLSYAQLVRPTRLRVHQNFNPNFISRIVITDIYGEQYVVYEQTPGAIGICPFVLDVDVPLGGTYPANRVTVFLNQTGSAGGFNQIDAVELIGVRY
jgi:hypothetical protein